MKKTNSFDVSRSDLAYFFGVSPKCINDWGKNGMPKTSHGLYNLKLVFDWWQKNIDGDSSEAMLEHKTRYWKEMADEKEIGNMEARGQLISRDEVVTEWCKRIAEVRQSLLALAVRLPPILEGKDAAEMRPLIKAEAVGVLEGYSRPGKHCETAEPPAKPAKKGKKK